jgi:hypothetical protein
MNPEISFVSTAIVFLTSSCSRFSRLFTVEIEDAIPGDKVVVSGKTCEIPIRRVDSLLGIVNFVEPPDPWEMDYDRWAIGIRPINGAAPALPQILWFDERSVDLIGVVERN